MVEAWKVYIRGNKDRGEEVIKVLEDCGASNSCGYIGDYDAALYFINHNGIIDSTRDYNAEFAKIIMDNYHELHLSEQWKDGDIIVENDTNPVYSVFRSKEGNGKFSEYFCVTIDGIIKANIFRSISKWHLANKEERKTFTNLLHKHCKDWDAEKKQVVDWKWEPKEDDDYYYIDNNGDILHCTWVGDDFDADCYDFGNCFRTEEEAKAMAEKVKKLLKGE